MPVALDQFVKQLADSGVISPGKLENFIPPKAVPKDAQELAQQLVQSKHLTKFQAQEIYAGRAKSLILGNYTILDKIGAGGMGQVFKAEHRRLKRVVAIKMLPAAMLKDAAAVARFQREVEAAAKLRHPNIVATDDADEANGAHFLVMEFAEGSDLSALVKRKGPLSVAKAVNYTVQAGQAMEYAHRHGVVHRDIKPANLLLDNEGTVKILDMGLARIEGGGDTATQAELTGSGTVLGTVDYMAPEQSLSTKHADARADIYSLGCTLYYLLTGKPTYDGETIAAKILAHHTHPPPDLRAAHTEVPEQLEFVFKRMVAKQVADRYQTMSEVIAALEEFSAGLPGGSTSRSHHWADERTSAFDVASVRDVNAAAVTRRLAQEPTVLLGRRKRLNWRWIGAGIVAGGLAALVVGFALFWLPSKQATLLLSINQPDAAVQMDENLVSIGTPTADGSYSLAVEPGVHRFRAEKGGFRPFVRNFEVKPGDKIVLKAIMIPLTKYVVAPGAHPNTPPLSQANAPFVEFDGFNGFWGSAGVPDDAFKKLKDVQKENKQELRCFAFAPGGEWILMCGNNDFYTNNPNLPVCKAIAKFREDGNLDFRCVAFAPTGGWTILWGSNGSWTEGQVPEEAFKKFGEIGTHGGSFRSIAYGPKGAWVLLYNTASVVYGNVPAGLAKVLDDAVQNGIAVNWVNFFGNDWICLSNNGWWTSNPESAAAKRIETNIKQGYQPKWIAVKPLH